MSRESRLVFGDINARNELEVIDNIYDRAIITTNSANILNIMNESSNVNPEEEVIRKRGRKKTPKVSLLPLRRSPRKLNNNNSLGSDSMQNSLDSSDVQNSGSDQTHDYFLRTPKKSLPSPTVTRAVTKLLMSPIRSSTPISPSRVSPRKRLVLNNTNDSGIDLSPALSGHQFTPNSNSSKSNKTVKSNSKKSQMAKRRRRRYF